MTPQRRWLVHSIVVSVLLTLAAAPVDADCEPEPITVNTPTGIAGCERWGSGVASHYGPGTGVAMNFCTWELRHSEGCGWVSITSEQTGITVITPVVDFCDCWVGTDRERIVDLQYSVVAALGLNWEAGLYRVRVERFREAVAEPIPALPDTSMRYTSMVGVSDESARIPRGPGSLAYSKSAGVIAWEHGE